MLAHGSPEQIDRWLRPALRGELHDAYAVTEEHAGSDPSGIRTTATRVDGGWRLDGEKWFVTYGDVAAVYIVMALAEGAPTLFLVEAGDAAGSPSSTTRRSRTTIRTGIRRSASRASRSRRGDRRASAAATSCSARGSPRSGSGSRRAACGAMWRLLEETTAWAIEREQGGARIIDHQGVAFPLGRLAPPTRPPAACSGSTSRGWPTPAPIRS